MPGPQFSFITSAGFELKNATLLITEVQRDITNVEYMPKFKGMTIYAKPVTLPPESFHLKGYLFDDAKRALEEKASLTSRLVDITDESAKVRLKMDDPASVRVYEIAGILGNFFDWIQMDNRIVIRSKRRLG